MSVVRNYQKSDYSSIKTILQEAKLFDEVWDSKENLSGMIENDPQSILVAEKKNKVVGNIFIIPYGSKIAYLFRLAVTEKYRKQGIGSSLIKKAEEIARKRRANEIGFYIDANNKKLKSFYKKRKFKTSNKNWIYMWKGIK